MALRVLLADESTTIKKVMQLALQDFAVEVKSVHAGIDVLDVARSYQPDIIFADVLLQKKNGYEVCASLKNDRELTKIPVVLMWSSFMDLDEASANSCGAEARLEKPFDVETLRKLVLELVPKTRSQRLAHFLEFSPRLNEELIEDPNAKAPPSAEPSAPPPTSQSAQRNSPQAPAPRAAPDVAPPQPARPAGPPPTSGLGERLAAKAAAAAAQSAPPVSLETERKSPPSPDAFLSLAPEPPPPASGKSSWSMESFEDPSQLDESEEFAPLELSQLSKDETPEEASLQVDHSDEDDEAWSRQDLSQFKLDLPPISVGEGAEGFNIDMGEEEFSSPGFETEAPPQPLQTRSGDDDHFGNDLTLEAQQINEAHDEIALPLEPLDEDELEITHSGALDGLKSSTATPPAGVNQMSAKELERVIRSQSREIIEQVVRKIVPELAATIIREELERLLEDTAVRENRNL
jgi:CheY-like chemotaxis protein